MSLAGSRVAGMVGWAPCSGKQTITVAIFSYAGGVTFGFGTDRSVLPDAQRLVEAFTAELAEAAATSGAATEPAVDVARSGTS
jgi:diacylglycerol O-acyltransferase